MLSIYMYFYVYVFIIYSSSLYCAGSSGGGDKNLKVGAQRRRLSVGEVDNSAAAGGDSGSEEADRGLITSLQADDVAVSRFY